MALDYTNSVKIMYMTSKTTFRTKKEITLAVLYFTSPTFRFGDNLHKNAYWHHISRNLKSIQRETTDSWTQKNGNETTVKPSWSVGIHQLHFVMEGLLLKYPCDYNYTPCLHSKQVCNQHWQCTPIGTIRQISRCTKMKYCRLGSAEYQNVESKKLCNVDKD